MRERESDANSRPQYGKLAQSLIALLALARLDTEAGARDFKPVCELHDLYKVLWQDVLFVLMAYYGCLS